MGMGVTAILFNVEYRDYFENDHLLDQFNKYSQRNISRDLEDGKMVIVPMQMIVPPIHDCLQGDECDFLPKSQQELHSPQPRLMQWQPSFCHLLDQSGQGRGYTSESFE